MLVWKEDPACQAQWQPPNDVPEPSGPEELPGQLPELPPSDPMEVPEPPLEQPPSGPPENVAEWVVVDVDTGRANSGRDATHRASRIPATRCAMTRSSLVSST